MYLKKVIITIGAFDVSKLLIYTNLTTIWCTENKVAFLFYNTVIDLHSNNSGN